MTSNALAIHSPFHGLLEPAGIGRGVLVSDRSLRSLTALHARKGEAGSLQSRLAGASRPLRTGPETWWSFEAAADLESVRDVAAIVDQSDAYGILRLSGPRVRDALAKLVFVDLHPDAFPAGHAASTVAAHVGVTLWRLEDGPEGAVFELACPRSYAASFWHALSESAAEFGLASSAA